MPYITIRKTIRYILSCQIKLIRAHDMPNFVDLTSQEFQRLSEFNIARYRLRLPEYWAWYNALHGSNAPPGRVAN